MNYKLPLCALLLATLLPSCQKMGALKSHNNGLTSELVVPIGFSWENSRNINIKVAVTDQAAMHFPYTITIYEKDPALGGHSIAKGSATLKIPFETSIYVPNQVSELFIVKRATASGAVILKVAIGRSDIGVSMGAPLLPASVGIKKTVPGIKS